MVTSLETWMAQGRSAQGPHPSLPAQSLGHYSWSYRRVSLARMLRACFSNDVWAWPSFLCWAGPNGGLRSCDAEGLPACWAVMLPWACGAWRTVSVTSRPLRPEGKTFSQTSISPGKIRLSVEDQETHWKIFILNPKLCKKT